ncbi:MAG: hypothetical protein U5N86_09470 [Planctomycetota bacterium]|nr:hypothetical protein [Planctomycetota bacterium]
MTSSKVFAALKKVDSDNVQNEYYLPDVLKVFLPDSGRTVRSLVCEDEKEVLGVNTVEQLAHVEQIMKERRNG